MEKEGNIEKQDSTNSIATDNDGPAALSTENPKPNNVAINMPERPSVPMIKRDTSHWFAKEPQYFGEHSDHLQRVFIFRVYGILSIQLAITIGICLLCMYNINVRHFCIGHAVAIYWSCLVTVLVALLGLYFYKTAFPFNIIWLSLFTIMESLLVGTICALYYEAGYGIYILEAWILTGALFVSLTFFTFQTVVKWNFIGAGTFSCVWLIFSWGMLSLWVGFAPGSWLALFGSLCFCIFIIIDTWRLTKQFGYDDYLVAAVDLYLDIIILFLYLLSLLSGKK